MTNNDLISREALKKAIKEEICNFELPISANEIMPIIDNAPTVDINTKLSVAYLKGRRQGQSEERPQGEWINLYPDGLIAGECSACHWQATQYEDDVVGMPYCPNCGARMKGGAKDDK